MHGRFGHLRASDVLPRLQLAALYAATGSLLPEPRSSLTGAQTAVQLVRQCWVDRPLTLQESEQLSDITLLGGHLVPALRLLVHELAYSSTQLNHLHITDKPVTSPLDAACPAADACSAYLQQVEFAHHSFLNLHMLLTPGEETRMLRTSHTADSSPDWLRLGHHKQIEVGASPVEVGIIKSVESQLIDCVVVEQSFSRMVASPYPLWIKSPIIGVGISEGKVSQSSSSGGGGGGLVMSLEEEMHLELKDSWHAFHSSPTARHVVKGTEEVILDKQVCYTFWSWSMFVDCCTP